MTLLETNVKFIAESLARHIYDQADIEVFAGDWSVNSIFMKSWLEAITMKPRSPSFLSSNSLLLEGIATVTTFIYKLMDFQVLEAYAGDVVNHTFVADSDILFYSSTTASMSIFRVKPIIFDIMLSLVTTFYIAFLFVIFKVCACLLCNVLQGPKESFKSLKSFLGLSNTINLKKKQ